MEYEKLIDLFDYALRMLYEKDHILLDVEAQERAVAGRLAIYLQHAFDPEFHDELCVDISSNNMVATNFRYPFASIPIAILIFVCAYFVDVVIKKIPLIGKWIV